MSANLAPLPLFYRRPLTVSHDLGAAARLPGRPDLAFAKGSNSIPVVLEELAETARCYPILFTNETKPMPIALVGLVGDDNLFVAPSAADPAVAGWTAGQYVPGYVRRYPFILMDTGEADRFTVCVDAEGLVGPDDAGAIALFDAEGKPSAALQERAEYCRAYHAGYVKTREWVDALQAADLLIEHQANITINNDRTFTFSGFQVIDFAKLAALPDETFLEWRRRGWLAPIYLHQASLLNWDRLISLALKPAAS